MLSPDGSVAYVANGDNTVSVIDTTNNTKVTGTIQAETGFDPWVAVSSDGTKLFVNNSSSFTLRTVTLTHLADPPPPTSNPNAGALFEDFNGPAGSAPNPNRLPLRHRRRRRRPAAGLHEQPGQRFARRQRQPRHHRAQETVNVPFLGTFNYTSAGFSTQDQFEFTYGTLEARIQFPADQGLWPVFWTLGSDIDTVGWPNAGEVDIMELWSGAGALPGPPSTASVSTRSPSNRRSTSPTASTPTG